MRKIIAIGGQPAVGKSTIMKKFFEKKKDLFIEIEPIKLVPCLFDTTNNLIVLGKYDEGEMFGGTDRYSMAVQPAATEFVKKSTHNIVFEGDRLFNQSFLEMLSDLPDTELQIVYITASNKLIEQRHKERKDTQSEIFIKGRVTKHENLRSNFTFMPYTKVFENDTQEDLEIIVSYLRTQLYNM